MKQVKYLQIFNYLLEFSKLRSKAVRNIESSGTQYPDILWFADIPQCEIIDCITFPNFNQDADYWLKIIKPKNEPQPPTFPKLNETLKEWIVKESLTDENGIPLLKDSAIVNGKTIFLEDTPEIEKLFQKYLNNNWIDDLEFYKNEYEIYENKLAEFEKQSGIFKHLFSINNKAKHFGEEFELVVGIGLLHFQENESTPLICRHILTSKAEITFESSARESSITVSPSVEKNEIQIETDAIIDLKEQFDSADIIEAEEKVKEFLKDRNIIDSLFDNQIREATQIFADRIRTDGQTKDDLTKSKEISKKPTVYFAPALLLRKRDTRSFSKLYKTILDDISNSDDSIDIPSINDIIGYLENPEEFPTNLEKNNSDALRDEIIYFPKKYNDEQIEIIEKAKRNNKVLVQGPPGTGKSHTIANLICHLLANGKKVLVTAYTKRALEVLEKQLPPEFMNLTVNLLSGDLTSIKNLDANVNAINDKLSNTPNLFKFKEKIEEQEIELGCLKEQKAITKNEWLKVKEKSTRRLNINCNYQGTLLEIAERIEKDIPTFTWFKEEFIDISKVDLIADVEKFISLTRYYQSVECSILNLIVPQKEKLVSLSELKEYRKIAIELAKIYSTKKGHTAINCNDYFELKKLLQELYKLLSEIENKDLPFKLKLIADYRNNLVLWENKVSRTNKILTELSNANLKQFDRSIEVEYPNDKSLIQIKSGVQTLLSYVNEGNSLSGVLFKLKKTIIPKDIKEKLYIIDEIKVNGSPCDTKAELQNVLDDIKIKQDFKELESIWQTDVNRVLKSYFDKAKFNRQLKENTENLISLLGEVNNVKAQIESISSVRIQNYERAKVGELINECDYNFLLTQAKVFKEKIAEVNKYLSIQNINPIATTITKTISSYDTEKYEQHLAEIDILNSKKEKYNNYKKLQEELYQHFPTLVKEILDNTFEFSNIKELANAIYFNHAFSEIKNLLAEDYESKLNYKLSDLEKQEEKLISSIASRKAWSHLLESFNNNPLLRRHLQAWVLAVKKIGKTGKGKRALKFRKEAQNQMDKCKDSIPCWIMPLYKVAETIIPKQGMYDYVIIDEASQLGADAIFLLYISKNIIIVGDDKQTSPEYVGVDADTMTPYINRHLQNILFANFYGTEFSFFDHAKMFCDGMIVLREHFRCMPEIIEFCNKNFYAPDGKGLYPLKQYSENRIEPLKSVYCQNGYIDGTYQNITNRIEAEAITNKIAELITDENYKGKSFGVIGLQGNKQASLIESLLVKKVGEVEFKKRNIVCGNSASFQGDERDIMFLSLITAVNHSRAALTRPEDERRFNVAVSRAKEQAWLFHSVLLDDLSNTNDLRYKLLDHFINYKPQPIPPQRTFERTMGTQPEPFESWFEVDVYNDIVTNNFSVIPQYEVAKGRYRIDLVTILSNGVKIAIECDGDKYHPAEQFQNDLMRQKVLERCGWQFFRVRGAEYYSNRKKALEPLWKLLSDNDIQKDKSPTTNNNQKNTQEETKNEIVEKIHPEIKRQKIQIGSKVEYIDFFRKKSPELVSSKSVKPTITEEKTNVNLFSLPEILVFTSMQNVYKIRNQGFTNLSQVISEIKFEGEEKPIYFTGTKDYAGYLIVAFQNGKAGKIPMTSYQSEYNRKKLKNAFNGESKLIFIEHIKNDIDLVALSSINKVALFSTNKINPVESRNTKGVQVLKQKDNSILVKVKKLDEVKLQDPEYYRKDQSLNVVGYYLKKGDEI